VSDEQIQVELTRVKEMTTLEQVREEQQKYMREKRTLNIARWGWWWV